MNSEKIMYGTKEMYESGRLVEFVEFNRHFNFFTELSVNKRNVGKNQMKIILTMFW